jgi:FtsP/CotA-like multicopper oxidase with cupredoxin domain
MAVWVALHGPVDLAMAAAQEDEYTLKVDYSEREFGPFRLRTRTYSSRLPGPLMQTRPGHTLRIKLINNLPTDPPATVPSGIDALNNPHAFNTTNLHVHGLRDSSSVPTPGIGRSSGAAYHRCFRPDLCLRLQTAR